MPGSIHPIEAKRKRYVNNGTPNWRRAYHEGIEAHYEQLLKDRHGIRTSDDVTIHGRTEDVGNRIYRVSECDDSTLMYIARRLAERDCNRAIIEYELARKRAAA